MIVEGNVGWFKKSTVSERAIGERQSEKRACLVLLLAQFSVSGVGVELPPVLRGGVVEQSAQRIASRHAALDVLSAIRCLIVGLSAPMEIYQLLLSPADPPVSDVAIPVRIVECGSDIELVTHSRQESGAFRFIVFVFVDVMVQITRGNGQVGLPFQVFWGLDKAIAQILASNALERCGRGRGLRRYGQARPERVLTGDGTDAVCGDATPSKKYEKQQRYPVRHAEPHSAG
jgi:hypothetical protein